MGSADNRTFKANFTANGAAMLREKVNEKLKEFMGNYNDDTLVEYVIVLLRNGRSKEQAKNELNVFLGDDTDPFISWLWDHLASNIDFYVQHKELQHEAPKKRLMSEVQAGGDGFQHLNSQSEIPKSSKRRSRHNKGWKGLVEREAEVQPVWSFEVGNIHSEEKTQSKVSRGPGKPSPSLSVQRKRGRTVEKRTKRDSVSQVTHDAPRRLLQFAVRDAVATSRRSNLGTPVESSLKRLRSVVSTSSVKSSLVECPQTMQTVSRDANPFATVIKAVAEAAEDVVNFKYSGSVFDRLGYDMNQSDGNSHLEDIYQDQDQNELLYHQTTDYSDQYAVNPTMLENENGFSSDSNSDNEWIDDVNVVDHRVNKASQFGYPGGNTGDNSLTVHYNVEKNVDDIRRRNQNRVQEQSVAAPNTSKIVNISVNVNAWKQPADGHKTFGSKVGAPKSGVQLVKENAKAVEISNWNATPTLDLKKESRKAQLLNSGSSVTGRTSEDADSRTVFASNVHFAATKDGLLRHFNRFGEVLKVVIATDAMTGQPKGAAYVEFVRKEAADNALSLDGTSFMSRILKVVRKSAAPQESAPAAPWPRIFRGSPLPSASFSRAPFQRRITGAFQPRPPIKFGARSLQWKRGAQGIPSDIGVASSASTISAPDARGLTYVRTESKLEGSLSST